MSVRVSLDDLLAACEWMSAGEAAAVECQAFVGRATGVVHWVGEAGDGDDEVPEDIDDESRYIAVPTKMDLGLGRDLVMRFVDGHLPSALDTVREYFRHRGAYGRFKSLLERHGKLDAWHQYEDAALENVLVEWCEEQGLEVTGRRHGPIAAPTSKVDGDEGLDNDRIDQAVLALLHLGLHEGFRTWKSFDWDVMGRLHEKGYISDPVGKAKSVAFTEEGLRESERLLKQLFGTGAG